MDSFNALLIIYIFVLGTPEVGGLTSIQGLEIVRGCKGLNIVGGDLVEVHDFKPALTH